MLLQGNNLHGFGINSCFLDFIHFFPFSSFKYFFKKIKADWKGVRTEHSRTYKAAASPFHGVNGGALKTTILAVPGFFMHISETPTFLPRKCCSGGFCPLLFFARDSRRLTWTEVQWLSGTGQHRAWHAPWPVPGGPRCLSGAGSSAPGTVVSAHALPAASSGTASAPGWPRISRGSPDQGRRTISHSGLGQRCGLPGKQRRVKQAEKLHGLCLNC